MNTEEYKKAVADYENFVKYSTFRMKYKDLKDKTGRRIVYFYLFPLPKPADDYLQKLFTRARKKGVKKMQICTSV
jgi:hypothetical protein